VSAGDLGEAWTRYSAGLAICERLAAADPGNTEWQRDLSVGHEKLGDLAEQSGDLAGAIRCYIESLPIAENLVDRWPDHPGFLSDLAITRRRIQELRAKE
jgi:hypothetical protein